MCWSIKRPSAYSRRGAEHPGNPGSYSALQFHPRGGRYAWLSPSASPLSVTWELFHCPVPFSAPPPALLWLMVGFIYIFFQQCCRASELPPLRVREAGTLSRGIHQVSSGRGSSTAVLLLPSPGWRGCSASSQAGPFSIPPTWGERREEWAKERRFRIKLDPKGRVELFFSISYWFYCGSTGALH